VDRRTWLDVRRAKVVACYDEEAPAYDGNTYRAASQREWVSRVLGTCPSGSVVLDAPCGTGKYFSMVAAAGHRVVGADQSAGDASAGPGAGHRGRP
jgi:ubiquinone/menaquinone biosynthesis C-methylase UbiE